MIYNGDRILFGMPVTKIRSRNLSCQKYVLILSGILDGGDFLYCISDTCCCFMSLTVSISPNAQLVVGFWRFFVEKFMIPLNLGQ